MALFSLPVALAAQAAPSCAKSGGQTWDTFENSHPLTRRTNLLLEGAVKTDCGVGSPHLYYWRAEGGFGFRPQQHLEIRSFYEFIEHEPGANSSNIIALEAGVVGIRLGNWRLSDRNRFEGDFFPSVTTSRYGNYVELARPMRLRGAEIEPFAEEVIKYDLRFHGWVYTRLQLGVTKSLTKELSVRAYYVRQNGSHLSPGSLNGIGIAVLTYF